jgi:hypothetical protein
MRIQNRHRLHAATDLAFTRQGAARRRYSGGNGTAHCGRGLPAKRKPDSHGRRGRVARLLC